MRKSVCAAVCIIPVFVTADVYELDKFALMDAKFTVRKLMDATSI